MEMSGSFAQKYYKDENKDMFKSLTEKRDDNRSNGCRGQEVNYLQQFLGLRINPSNRKPQ